MEDWTARILAADLARRGPDLLLGEIPAEELARRTAAQLARWGADVEPPEPDRVAGTDRMEVSCRGPEVRFELVDVEPRGARPVHTFDLGADGGAPARAAEQVRRFAWRGA